MKVRWSSVVGADRLLQATMRQQFYDELARRRHRAQIAARHVLEREGRVPVRAPAAVRVDGIGENDRRPRDPVRAAS
jgi:hypothetical protein